MKQKLFNLIILFLAIYFLISDISIVNQIELFILFKVKDNESYK
ncbi:hypothetical protein [Aliarcobacter butzleri]|nr:hypothetical protein [Aliarcobacter butzleri]